MHALAGGLHQVALRLDVDRAVFMRAARACLGALATPSGSAGSVVSEGAVLDQLFISLLNGLSSGLLLFMLSSGLTLIFSMMGVLNFAHASFYMVGAYVAYSLVGVVGFWFALLLAPLAVGVLFKHPWFGKRSTNGLLPFVTPLIGNS